jgi:hemolysin III
MATTIVPGWGLRQPVSAGTHFLAFLCALWLTALLWRLARGNRRRQLSLACFGVTMALLYGASSAYHGVRGPDSLIPYLRRLDYSAIYLLIAGTYTPVLAVLLRGRLRVALLALVWTIAAVGIACKWLLPVGPYWLSVGLYIGMGWLVVIPLRSLVRAVGLRAMGVALVGGLFYTVAGVLDAVAWPMLYPGVVGPHEVVHVLDMGGTFAHVVFIVRYVLPFRG